VRKPLVSRGRLVGLGAVLALAVGLLLVAQALGPQGSQGGAARPAAPRDTWTGVERIVAVGDVHGDYAQFVKVLRAAGVIDEANRWAAGKTHLVQTGDVLDRGPDSRKAMDLLMDLEAQAARAGGAVHALIGNHEAMVLLDDWRYVHPGEVAAFGSAAAWRRAMGPDGTYGRWIRSHPTAIRVNDLLFVHAGIVPAVARRSLADINQTVLWEIQTREVTGLLGSEDGPLWDRSLVDGDEETVARQLDAILKRYGARRMVVGHSVVPDGRVTARAGGRLIMIDVGMAEYYGGPAACLVVEGDTLWEVRSPGLKRRIPLDEPAPAPASAPIPAPAPAPVLAPTSRAPLPGLPRRSPTGEAGCVADREPLRRAA